MNSTLPYHLPHFRQDHHTQLQFGDIGRIDTDMLMNWAEKGSIWFDYFSIPQVGAEDRGKEGEGKDQSDEYLAATAGTGGQHNLPPSRDGDASDAENLVRAVESIPGYIECCELFIVLAPPCPHKNNIEPSSRKSQAVPVAATIDYGSWSRRGWCRAELIARLFARNTGPVIKIDSAHGKPSLFSAWEAYQMRPGDGNFSCCARNHRFETLVDGKTVTFTVPCDKPKVRRFMDQMLTKK